MKKTRKTADDAFKLHDEWKTTFINQKIDSLVKHGKYIVAPMNKYCSKIFQMDGGGEGLSKVNFQRNTKIKIYHYLKMYVLNSSLIFIY